MLWFKWSTTGITNFLTITGVSGFVGCDDERLTSSEKKHDTKSTINKLKIKNTGHLIYLLELELKH